MNWKLTYFFFCCHPKLDTGTWTIASTFTSAVMFLTMFMIAISYSSPNCFCPHVWEHINLLPPDFKIVYFIALGWLFSLTLFAFIALCGTFKAQHKKLIVYLLLLSVTELGIFGASIYVLDLVRRLDQFLSFEKVYWKESMLDPNLPNGTGQSIPEINFHPAHHATVLKDNLMTDVENVIAVITRLVSTFLGLESGEKLSIHALMEAVLKDEAIAVIGGVMRMLRTCLILLLIGINSLFITFIFIAGSHYQGLKQKTLRSATEAPDLIMCKVVLSSSKRSTTLETLSDCSGTNRIKTKDCHRCRGSTRSSQYAT